MTLVVDVMVQDERWTAVDRVAEQIEGALALAAAEAGAKLAEAAEVSVALLDDAAVGLLNARWRGIDAPTNVLSFPAVEPAALAKARLLGDIVLGFETAAREAAAAEKPLSDHIIHLVVHGFLHLLGYDHAERQEAEEMERLERRILARLDIPDPYTGTLLADEVHS